MADLGTQHVPATEVLTLYSLYYLQGTAYYIVWIYLKKAVGSSVSFPALRREPNRQIYLNRQPRSCLLDWILNLFLELWYLDCQVQFNASSVYLFSDCADLQRSLDIIRHWFIFETPTLN